MVRGRYSLQVPEILTPLTFEPHVGSVFSITVGVGSTVSAELDKVVRHEPRSHGDRTQPFSLLFVGQQGQPLPQATYSMKHATLGQIDIFLVPIGPLQDGRQQYEAVFN